MDTQEIVNILIEQRDRLSSAIAALTAGTKRIGRPPKNTRPVPDADSIFEAAIETGKRVADSFDQSQSDRMKLYWKKRKAKEARAQRKATK